MISSLVSSILTPVAANASGAADKTEQVIQVMSKETSGTLGYQLGQQMQLEVFSLKGFNKAIAELRKRAPKGK